MARTLRKWLSTVGTAIRAHPHIARFLGNDTPQLWVPQRRSVALGAAIGAAVSVVPLPAQALIAAMVAIRFHAHLPTAVALTFLSNPLTALPLWGLAWMLGALCLGQPLAWPEPAVLPPNAEWAAWMKDAAKPLLVGIPLLATMLSLSFFGLTRLGWRLAVVCKWRSRHAPRTMSS